MSSREAVGPPVAAIAIEPPFAVPRRGARAAYVAVFLAFLDNFALLPLIAPRAQELGANALGVGLAVAAYSLTNLLLNLVGGALTDRIGRRAVVLLSLARSPRPPAPAGCRPFLERSCSRIRRYTAR